ncbi:MAG: hypothetical protein SFV15_09925 [Polyangiaceae bacterium]|nr:hypothetical protein [Polyangiaceae bacterium]
MRTPSFCGAPVLTHSSGARFSLEREEDAPLGGISAEIAAELLAPAIGAPEPSARMMVRAEAYQWNHCQVVGSKRANTLGSDACPEARVLRQWLRRGLLAVLSNVGDHSMDPRSLSSELQEAWHH